MTEIYIKRVYEPTGNNDGFRILVDRLWPRGINKEKANIDAWLKEVAPSAALRKWFNHEPAKWKSFVEKYTDELKKSEAVNELQNFIKKHKIITLLYAVHDEQHNNAVVLQNFMQTNLDN
ncbi:DUF488 domain-containing protein [Ginsengibacter hankyongi]|uniref:DUF488 domain-containing protein n=1 Tax=Ginsengibacter hankyongi TaxID=2607284 RepID=UPI0019272747|nr:DUF488 domain-containing protein [Ginsengibacter hankyongi]